MRAAFFATVGILVVILGVIVWEFGFFHKEIKGVMTQLDRATAVDRAEAMLDKSLRQADSLEGKAHETRVKARMIEYEINRDEENLNKTKFAIEQLAQTVKSAGLPKPSKAGSLTDEQKQTKIVFAGKEGSAMDAYNQLSKWQIEYEQKKSVLDAKRDLIVKLNERADQMISKQSELYAVIEKLKVQLANLETARTLAAIDAEMAELGATAEGINLGNVGKMLDIIETEIDELNARRDVANEEIGKSTNGDVFSKPEVSSVSYDVSSLDALWN